MAIGLRIHRASARGPRLTMEDREIVTQRQIGSRVVTLAAVFDGHGGSEVADRAAAEFDLRFFAALPPDGDVGRALERACADVAQACAAHAHVGSTACAAVLVDGRLTAAWVGDSELIVATARGVRAATTPHRLRDERERARVVAAGAQVDGPYVIRGDRGLMMTRALGDAWFHPVGVIATPSLLRVDLDRDATHVAVVATDGLWDVVSPDMVVTMLAAHESRDDFDYARTLVQFALATNTHDNVAAITLVVPAGAPS